MFTKLSTSSYFIPRDVLVDFWIFVYNKWLIDFWFSNSVLNNLTQLSDGKRSKAIVRCGRCCYTASIVRFIFMAACVLFTVRDFYRRSYVQNSVKIDWSVRSLSRSHTHTQSKTDSLSFRKWNRSLRSFTQLKQLILHKRSLHSRRTLEAFIAVTTTARTTREDSPRASATVSPARTSHARLQESNGHQLSAEEAIRDNSEPHAALSPIKPELTKMAANYFLETPKTGILVIYILINDSQVLGRLRSRAWVYGGN